MTKRDRAGEAQRRRAGEDQDAQDFLGRVGDRRQRVGRQHGEAGDPRQALVMREVRGDRLADEEPLELREKRLLRTRDPSNGRRG